MQAFLFVRSFVDALNGAIVAASPHLNLNAQAVNQIANFRARPSGRSSSYSSNG